MPRITNAIAPSDSDDSIIEVENAIVEGDWSEMNFQNMDSLQFSEYSHTDYDKQSHFLRSDSGISTLLGGSSISRAKRRSPGLSVGNLSSPTKRKPPRAANASPHRGDKVKKDDDLFLLVQRELSKETLGDGDSSMMLPTLPKAGTTVRRVKGGTGDVPAPLPEAEKEEPEVADPPESDKPSWGLPNLINNSGHDDSLKEARRRRPADRTGGRAASVAYVNSTQDVKGSDGAPGARVATAEGKERPSARKMTLPPQNTPSEFTNVSDGDVKTKKVDPKAVLPSTNKMFPSTAEKDAPPKTAEVAKSDGKEPTSKQVTPKSISGHTPKSVVAEQPSLPSKKVSPKTVVAEKPTPSVNPVPSKKTNPKSVTAVHKEPATIPQVATTIEPKSVTSNFPKKTVPVFGSSKAAASPKVPSSTNAPSPKSVSKVPALPGFKNNVTPSNVPSRRASDAKAESPSASSKGASNSVSRNPSEEKLTDFVRSVADAEVLHVIYDYLCEEVTLARYDNARQVCKDLLERKEKLLQTTNSHGITPVMDEKDSDDEEDDEDEVNSEDDEFDDFNIRNSPYPFNNKFRFGEPSVSGFVSKVFKEGMLFRVVDEKGNYHFYNDTLRHIMMVRVRYVLTGAEKVNERAIVSDVQDGREGEREVAIAVLPEETNFLIGNINGRLPSISAKAVQTPDDFVPPSLAKSISAINMDINTVRNSLGQWERATDQSAFLKCCIKKKLRFTDLNFRPSSQSLFRPDCDSVRIPSMTWRRPEQYLYLTELSEARLFRGEISCHLVRQGELLNHTLISGIAAVAMRPDHVRWMFRHPVSAQVGKLERSVGCYSVKLVHNGWWSSFIVDNYFPACMKGPLFARCPADPRRLWVSVLEKAYAKSLGSYSSTCLADLMEVLSDFTGYPYRYFTQDWFLASNCPTTSHSSKLFHFIQKCVASDYLIAVFTPTEEEEEGGTQSVLRKRSSRLIPVNGLLPQFLPGRVYFITDAAYYSELDLKMVRLKNPWTWEAQRNAQKERVKKWKYTAWYDQPDNSISMMSGSTRVADKLGKKKMTDDDRKGTMWLEWKEALSSFTGGGVCYTAWQWRQYKMQNVFVSGFPNFVLEMRTKKKVEGFVTLTLEGIRDTLDEQGNITGSFQKGDALCGVGLVAVRPGIGKADAFEIAGRACEDTECFAAQMNYLKSRDTSMKFSIINSSKPYYFIPVMDPAYLTQHPTVKEMPFVLSVVSSSPSDTDTDGFQILFKKIPNTCQVYNDVQKFSIQSTTAVEANYQLVGERGVKTFKGSAIDDVVFKEECVKK